MYNLRRVFLLLHKSFLDISPPKGHNTLMRIETQKKLAAGLSITSNAVIILLKLVAGIISGSISIISEAIHSLSDFLASIITFFAVMRSSEPADAKHPYGHGRYEDMSGFIEGGLIVFAGLFIIYEAAKKLVTGISLQAESSIGIAVMGVAVVANYLVSSYLFYVAKKSGSVSLFADGEHLRTDIWSSLGVLVGLVLIKITGITLLDPLIAIIVALFILRAGLKISKSTLDNLLDSSLPPEDLNEIETIIKGFEQNSVIGVKSLKTRRVGPSKEIECTLLFPENMTILNCHNICDEIEDKISQKLGTCSVLIHAEPDCAKCRNVKV